MTKKFLPILGVIVIATFVIGMITLDPQGSRSPYVESNNINPVVTESDAVKFVDSLNGANDSNSLKSRGYKLRRGALCGPPGTNNGWFQGNATVFPAFNGPTTGYVAANYNTVSGTNTIDLWLITPTINAAAGDTVSFYERSPTASTYPDSIRVHWASNGDTNASTGSWVELGRFKTTTTGSWSEKRFVIPTGGANGRIAINYFVVNGGPTGNNSDFIGIDFIRVLGPAAASDIRPELMYYKFENNPSPSLVGNCAKTPVGTNPAPLLNAATPLGSGGQFDSCLSGNTTPGLANLGGVNTGWLTSMPANWTISFWMGAGVVDGNPSYIFGDPGAASFRCFYGGAAGANSILLRGFGADILITAVGTTAVTIHITYNGTNVIVYKNGVVFGTFPRTATPTGGTGFRVGSYNTAFVSHFIGKIDEFRLYNRALDQAEVTATWNSDLGGCGITGIQNTNSEIPASYNLSQNYPNPFNPTTNIKFSIPNSGLVKLVVFDVLGKEVATLVNEEKSAGNYTADFNASHLSSGVYFYRLESGSFIQTKKMLLVK